MRRSLALAMSLTLAFTASVSAHHKPGHHMPPGQANKKGAPGQGTKIHAPGQMEKVYDPELVIPTEVEFVCLVTTDIPGDPYSRVSFTEWLPRDEAEAKADEGKSFVIYHPDLNTEEGCVGF
ncbi:hypothetical protein [Devosia sp. RR2S18]|uniref:hypothetical protein n=1 Tax=Devosia rhizosphaerae TaxID=3049774 RepID=UPI002540D362|nr:hypothetical protein [Devosia sp. RR2S18]WIJ25890.1 hypothetical protein QOV41_03755 [Devosia sp. RR2S18]